MRASETSVAQAAPDSLTVPRPGLFARPAPMPTEIDAPAEQVEAAAPPPADEGDSGELVLGSETIVPDAGAPAPAAEEEAPRPMSGRRRWLTGGDDTDDAAPAPAPASGGRPGGTLFERMANSGRGARSDDDDDRGGPDIPRFLHRQNNQ